MQPRYNKNLTGTTITDEVITVTSTTAIGLEHDTYLSGASFIISTAPSGGGTILVLDTDYTYQNKDTALSTEAGTDIYTKISIINGTYHNVALYVSYKTAGDYYDASDINRLIASSKYETEIFALPYNRATDIYFPNINLSTIDGYSDISATNYPDLVPILRTIRSGLNVGMTGEKYTFDVTNWAISSNVVTLTFSNTTENNAMLNNLYEDYMAHGSYTGWRSVTLATAIGSVTAGDYAITGVNTGTRTITFALTATNGSGSVTATVEFYTFRKAGTTTVARLFDCQGMALHSVNDANYYFTGGFRRRDEMQGHKFDWEARTNAGNFVNDAATRKHFVNTSDATIVHNSQPTIVSDGTNGTPRIGKTTHSPALGVFLYMHAGRYIA